jgi:predicted Zn finger-like uncharacterized protein
MYTKCPYCQTCFRVSEAHLQAAKGKVRCGSCKEIFDATDHLYEGVPGSGKSVNISRSDKPVSDAPQADTKISSTPPASEPAPRFNEIKPGGPEIPEHEHEHIDLSAPPDRAGSADQSEFMESIVGEYSRYNNLDEMGAIKIPGTAEFTDSFIKHVDAETEKTTPPEQTKSEAQAEEQITNPYADIESKEEPATTQERDGIDALYSAADNQMSEDDMQQQLDKDIEALLEDDLSFDDEISLPGVRESDGKKDAPNKKVVEEPASFSDLDSKQHHFDTDIHLDFGDQPALVPDEDEPAPRDVVSSESIWAKKQIPETEDTRQTDKNAVPQKPSAKKPEDHLKENFDDDFLDLNSTNLNLEEEIEFEDIAEPVDQKPQAELKETPVEEVQAKHPDIEEELPSLDHDIPKALRSSFEHFESQSRSTGITIAMVFGMIILVVALLSQAVLFRSYQLANQLPSLKPILSSLCNNLPCRYSGSMDVSQIEVMNRDMRSHPSEKNALLVSTTFVNKASFDQPYPIVAIKLFDLSGDTVATRYFNPEEYLENFYSDFLLMESGTPVHVTLAVLDPGDDAVNFEISFQ